MRRQKEYANTVREHYKKLTKTPITPTKEAEDKDKDKEVPMMKVRDLNHMNRVVVRVHTSSDAQQWLVSRLALYLPAGFPRKSA